MKKSDYHGNTYLNVQGSLLVDFLEGPREATYAYQEDVLRKLAKTVVKNAKENFTRESFHNMTIYQFISHIKEGIFS